MYYPSSENKGADQLRGYREADLRLCFRICKLLVFPRSGSNVNMTVPSEKVVFANLWFLINAILRCPNMFCFTSNIVLLARCNTTLLPKVYFICLLCLHDEETIILPFLQCQMYLLQKIQRS